MRWLLKFSLIFLALIGSTSIASAHATPTGSNPADNATLTDAPSLLSITFTEPIVPELSGITMISSTGEKIETVAATFSQGDTIASIELPTLDDGAYLVSWRVTSAVDGHNTTGTYSFGIGVDALSTANQITFFDQIYWTTATARALRLIGIALLIGLFAYQLFVTRTQAKRTHFIISIIAIALIAIAALITLISQLIQYDISVLGAWLGTTFGRMWLFRLILLIPAFYFARSMQQDHKHDNAQINLFGFCIAIGIALTNAMSSHSAATTGGVLQGIAIDLAHVGAAGVWGGGLLMLLNDLRHTDDQSDRQTMFVSFSTMAVMAMALLFLTGGWLGGKHVGSWTALVGTTYGLLLLAKIALMVPVLAIAAYNLFVVGRNPILPAKLNRIILIEAICAFLIVLTAGFLSDTQRGIDAPRLTAEAGQATLVETDDGLTITTAIEPALVGNNSFDIIITDQQTGDPVIDAEKVTVRFTYLDDALGSNEAVATHRGNGVYSLDGTFITVSGGWQIEVIVVRPGQYDTFIPYRLEAGVGGDIRALDAGISWIEQFGLFMQKADKAGTAFLLITLALIWAVIATRGTEKKWQTVPMLMACAAVLWLGVTQGLDYYENEYTPSKFQRNPITPNAASIAQGKELWEASCTNCHGIGGEADGILARTLTIPPANFGDVHTAIHTDGDLYYWITYGKNNAMPPWPSLSDEERWHLVNYVRRLALLAEANYGN